MKARASIRRCMNRGSEPACSLIQLLCVLSLVVGSALFLPGCDQANEHIIFVPLEAYDPYPYLNAEGIGADAARTTQWHARQVVLESEITARFEARAIEYETFLQQQSQASDFVRKPRPARTVTLARPVDINRANAAQLQQLPRVGPATSARIIAGRPYSSASDLLRVRGIGPRTLEQLAPLIVVNGQ